MSVLDLRDAYHTLKLTNRSQKFCGITLYYGSPTYFYLRLGMGISASPAIWQQFVEHIIQELKYPDDYKIIMDDALVFTTVANHISFQSPSTIWNKISPHKCQFFRDNLIFMGLKFIIKDEKACNTPMKDKCDAIHNLAPPKSIKELRHFCGMVHFLSSFLPKLRVLLISIYELLKKKNLFNWTNKWQQAFDHIKDLCIQLPVLHMPNPTGKFHLGSDTS